MTMVAELTAEEILYATNSRLKSGCIDEQPGKIVWNLDELTPGDWFIAIPSERHDPHDDLSLAIERGARGCIVNRRSRYAAAAKDAVLISVPDTRTALLDIVRYWRHRVQPRVVGVTGSNGRRVTMMLLSQLLQNNAKTHIAFMENLGWFGCVREVLSMPQGTDVLIFEAGAVARGDIARIGSALDPDLVVLTQIRHPLPSPEREALTAALYCELLETLPEFPNEKLAAVIYDKNPAMQKRADQVLKDLLASRHSLSGKGIAERLSESALHQLSEAMQSAISEPVSRAEVWCAVEAAKALGMSTSELEEIFELDGQDLGHQSGLPSVRLIG